MARHAHHTHRLPPVPHPADVRLPALRLLPACQPPGTDGSTDRARHARAQLAPAGRPRLCHHDVLRPHQPHVRLRPHGPAAAKPARTSGTA